MTLRDARLAAGLHDLPAETPPTVTRPGPPPRWVTGYLPGLDIPPAAGRLATNTQEHTHG